MMEAICKREVESILVLDDCALHWQVTLSPETAVKVLEARAERPCYRCDVVLPALVKDIGDVMPVMDYGPNNVNTGHKFHEITIGREYSRVLYVRLNPSYGWNVWDIPEYKAEIIEKVEDICEHCAYPPDEFDLVENGKSLRLWWD